ncbi:MAG: polyphosphate polymerase domain-containing protein [Acutalibacteraceae bacterium]|nr:polyphosphate polymerase domain-containing protein [Acutalibacteraceae bacterium]
MGYKGNFKRVEKKYLITEDKFAKITEMFNDKMHGDEYGRSTICNIYFDTHTYQLIRQSVEKPLYKEKLRLRTYGIPDDEDNAFIELKKKFKGVVYKRRINMPYKKAYDYLVYGISPEMDTQIFKEIEWFLKFYDYPKPSMVITYDRIAFYGNDDPELRITFDRDITWRREEPDLRKGVFGNKLLADNEYIMEIKVLGAMPLWLSKLLNDEMVFPSPYSKYGNAYKTVLNSFLEEKESNEQFLTVNYRRNSN